MEYVSGNIFIREGGPLDVDASVVTHSHSFDHTTYVAHGAFRIEQLRPIAFDVNEHATDFEVIRAVEKSAGQGKNWVLIKAGVYHRLTSLEAGSIYHCIYSHNTPQDGVSQVYEGWQEAYG